MKFSVNPKLLDKALEAVLPIARQSLSRDDMPGLAQITASADGSLVIRSASYDGRVTSRLHCDVATAGQVCLNGEELEHILSKANGDEAVLTAQKSAISLSAGRARFRLSLYPPDSFYEWPDIEDPQYEVTFSSADALALFDGVLHARKNDRSMSDSTSGIYVEPQDNSLSVVTTDTHRLALRSIPVSEGKSSRGALLSLATIERLISCAKTADELVLRIGPRNVTIETDQVTYDMRLLGSVFPDYRRVIPDRSVLAAVVERKQMMEITERLMTIRPDLNRISVEIVEDAIHLQASREANLASENIDLEYTVDPKKYDPDGGKLVFDMNGKFLTETLKSLDCALVEIHVHGPERPLTIRPHRFVQDGEIERDALDLIMPLA